MKVYMEIPGQQGKKMTPPLVNTFICFSWKVGWPWHLGEWRLEMWSSTPQCWEPCSTVLGAALSSSTTLMPPAKEQWISGLEVPFKRLDSGVQLQGVGEKAMFLILDLASMYYGETHRYHIQATSRKQYKALIEIIALSNGYSALTTRFKHPCLQSPSPILQPWSLCPCPCSLGFLPQYPVLSFLF